VQNRLVNWNSWDLW